MASTLTKRQARRQAEREAKLEALQQRLTTAVEGLVTGEDWRRALEFSAKFHSRSFRNSMLIAVQHAEAYEQGRVPTPFPTYVAGYKQGLTLGRAVGCLVVEAPGREREGATGRDRSDPHDRRPFGVRVGCLSDRR